MRVYEFSKKNNIPSKEILELLNKEGFQVASHMAVLTNDAIVFLNSRYGKATKEEPKAAQPSTAGTKNIMQKQEQRTNQTNRQNTTVKRSFQQRPSHQTAVSKEQRVVPTEIILKPMTAGQLADILCKPVTDVIVTMLRWGVVTTINQMVDENMVQRIADYYEIKTVRPSLVTKETLSRVTSGNGESLLETRLPIVVILGHVDHGKTTLLDYIRKTRVASREKGGITQHLGAYEAVTNHGNIVFLDTPGHEAFPKIRQRGVRVADIAVLIVAADDGVMPQTLEALKIIKEMKVPLVVAINKMDKADPVRIDVIKQQLAQYNVMPEEWGGDTIFVPVSAKTGAGVDNLLEMLILQSQMLELRSNPADFAKGFVLESKIEKGRGAVATVICQHGTVQVGDYFVCGQTVGHVTSLVDSRGNTIQKAGPSVPVLVAGFEDMPAVGDFFDVVPKDSYKKARSSDELNELGAKQRVFKEGALNLIIKADTNSSREAVVESLEKVSKKVDFPFNLIASGVGDISESDVELAFNTGAEIIGFHIRAESNAQQLASRRGITITLQNIIYKLLETYEERAQSNKTVEMVKTKIGEAEVLRVFDIKGVGVVAGCMVKDGRFVRDSFAMIFRSGRKIGEGKISSLQREKRSVKEVHTGFDCGFLVEGFKEFTPGDRVDCFIELPKK